jgi:hypothetical protein
MVLPVKRSVFNSSRTGDRSRGQRGHVLKDMYSRAARDPKRLIVFTDGSRHAPKSYKRTGAAFVIYYGGEVVASGKIGLGPGTTHL